MANPRYELQEKYWATSCGGPVGAVTWVRAGSGMIRFQGTFTRGIVPRMLATVLSIDKGMVSDEDAPCSAVPADGGAGENSNVPNWLALGWPSAAASVKMLLVGRCR